MKKRNGFIIICFLFVIALLVGCGGNPYQKQLDLGYKYLQEEKYEEAIVAMNKAIDIDDKRPEAYIGLGSVFVTRCDENAIADASDALKKGYEKSKSDQIVQAFLDLAEQLTEKGKPDWAVQLLDFGYKLTNDEKLMKKSEELSQAAHEDTLKQLISLCEGKEYKKIAEILNSDELKKEMVIVTAEVPLISMIKADSNLQTGTGIGIYKGKDNDPRYYIYYGDFVKGIRSGGGIWITGYSTDGNDLYYTVFSGEWQNDAPNGQCTEIQETPSWVGNGELRIDLCESAGTVENGLWNSAVTLKMPGDIGVGTENYVMNYKKGIVEVISKENSEEGIYYIISISQNGTQYALDEEQTKWTWGVDGFTDASL